jgi:hypothetical protein
MMMNTFERESNSLPQLLDIAKKSYLYEGGNLA